MGSPSSIPGSRNAQQRRSLADRRPLVPARSRRQDGRRPASAPLMAEGPGQPRPTRSSSRYSRALASAMVIVQFFVEGQPVSTRGACRRTAAMEQSPIRLRRPPKLRNAGGSTTLRSPRRRAYLVVVPDRDPRGPGGDRAAARWAIGVFGRVEGRTVPDRPSSRCTPCSDSITRLRRVADFLDLVRGHMAARARALWTCSSRTARDATSWNGQTVAMMGVLAMIAVAVSHIDAWRIPVCSDVSARIQLAPSLRLS